MKPPSLHHSSLLPLSLSLPVPSQTQTLLMETNLSQVTQTLGRAKYRSFNPLIRFIGSWPVSIQGG
jgi:hypothetical protein